MTNVFLVLLSFIIFETEMCEFGPTLRMQHVGVPISSFAVPRKSVAAGLGGLKVDSLAVLHRYPVLRPLGALM